MESAVLNTSTQRIVVVDDHTMVREGLVALLGCESDFEVVGEAESPLTAQSLISEHSPDIVLTDIGMPESPFEMLRECLKKNPNLKVIFITAYDTEMNLERALGVGAKGIISKVTQGSELCYAIREVAAGREYFSEDISGRISMLRQIGNSREVAARHRLLSPREFEVLRCVAKGMPAKAIAKELHISVKTVDRHKSNIMTKLDIHSQVELARYAIREGIITP
jgi:DNA-binding NarL/FixJ family response regulator